MPKYLKILIALSIISLPIYSFAKGFSTSQNQGNGSQQSDSQKQGQGGQGTTGASYENQIQTQNQGEDQNLQVSNQQESQGSVATINERSSEVSKYVQELLDSTDNNSGIGEQVREVARNQSQSQEKIMEKVQKMEQRGTLARFLFGPKNEDIDGLKREMTQTQARIQTLEDLKPQLTNIEDQQAIESLIGSLTAQDTALTQKVLEEESSFSIFGALKALFK